MKIIKLSFITLMAIFTLVNLPLSIVYLIYGSGYIFSGDIVPGSIGLIVLIMMNLPFILFLYTLTNNFREKKESKKNTMYTIFLITTVLLIIVEGYLLISREIGFPSG